MPTITHLKESSSMDRRSRTGFTGAVSLSDLEFTKGVGRSARAVALGSRTLVDGLMNLMGLSFIGVDQNNPLRLR